MREDELEKRESNLIDSIKCMILRDHPNDLLSVFLRMLSEKDARDFILMNIEYGMESRPSSKELIFTQPQSKTLEQAIAAHHDSEQSEKTLDGISKAGLAITTASTPVVTLGLNPNANAPGALVAGVALAATGFLSAAAATLQPHMATHLKRRHARKMLNELEEDMEFDDSSVEKVANTFFIRARSMLYQKNIRVIEPQSNQQNTR